MDVNVPEINSNFKSDINKSLPNKPEYKKEVFAQMRVKELESELDRIKSSLAKVISERNLKMKHQFKGLYKDLYDSLTRKSVTDGVAQRLVYLYKEAKSELQSEGFRGDKLLKEHFTRKLSEIFPTGNQIRCNKKRCNIVTMVGPTGVGKTTTIAKLAAHFSLMREKKVALISADTYRIAAADQLKTYADIIGIPIDIVYTPKELESSIQKYKSFELIFIDTAGRSPSNTLQMSELQAYMHAAKPDEVHLVLSATSKEEDLLLAIEKYRGLNIKSLLFTKLDETEILGPIINISQKLKKPLSYFGTGQNVPEDIESANMKKLSDFILKDIKFE